MFRLHTGEPCTLKNLPTGKGWQPKLEGAKKITKGIPTERRKHKLSTPHNLFMREKGGAAFWGRDNRPRPGGKAFGVLAQRKTRSRLRMGRSGGRPAPKAMGCVGSRQGEKERQNIICARKRKGELKIGIAQKNRKFLSSGLGCGYH